MIPRRAFYAGCGLMQSFSIVPFARRYTKRQLTLANAV